MDETATPYTPHLKAWTELTIVEQIDRLREIVKQDQCSLAALRERLDRLEEHTHADGKLLGPLLIYRGQNIGASSRMDYF